MPNIVYILTNEAMPGYIKIGRTDTSIEQRVRELDRTNIPLPFTVFLAVETALKASEIEWRLHSAFGIHRERKNREFFKMGPERAAVILEAFGKDITPERDIVENEDEQVALDLARARRPAFNFEMVKIPLGETITFDGDEAITAKVDGKASIAFESQTTSLNKASLIVLARKGKRWKSVQGPAIWLYQGETLDERRRRMEAAGSEA